MNKSLLIDHTSFQQANLTILENKQLGEGKSLITLVGKLQEAEQKNGNGRVYPREILEREVKKYADGPVKTRTA
jgi:tRNA A37 threonylcarbamoyladenosine synthetase subunit TsaC/SUA5/YrdC